MWCRVCLIVTVWPAWLGKVCRRKGVAHLERIEVASLSSPEFFSTSQLPFKTPQIPSNRNHNTLNRGTFWGCRCASSQPLAAVQAAKSAPRPAALGGPWVASQLTKLLHAALWCVHIIYVHIYRIYIIYIYTCMMYIYVCIYI